MCLADLNFGVWNFYLEKKNFELLNFEKEFHVFQFSQILLKNCAYKGLGIKLRREANKLETESRFSKKTFMVSEHN